MDVMLWVLFGAIVSWIASILADSNHQQTLNNLLVGITGAIASGTAMKSLSGTHIEGLNIYSLLVAVGGSLLIITIFRWRPFHK